MDVLSEVLKVVKLQGALFLQRRIFLAMECCGDLVAIARAPCRARRGTRNHLSPAH